MKEIVPLNSISTGTTSVINSIQSSEYMKRRLLDLGFSKGTSIKCVQRSPYGDPIAYMLRGTIIALRSEDANQIFVIKGGNDSWD